VTVVINSVIDDTTRLRGQRDEMFTFLTVHLRSPHIGTVFEED
jgi:hypothetical protein